MHWVECKRCEVGVQVPPVYTVHAFRFGDTERHSYIVGVFSSDEQAVKAAEEEEKYRGGKYRCEVLVWSLNEGIEQGKEVLGGHRINPVRAITKDPRLAKA